MKFIYFILASLLLTSCMKAEIAPATTPAKTTLSVAQTSTVVKADTVKSVNADTNTSNPDYWFNGTKGTAVIQVTCKDCTAMATIGTVTIPFIFNADGIGKLKYTPAPGLSINIAVCPDGTKAIKADISNGTTSVYAYSGVITANWAGTYKF